MPINQEHLLGAMISYSSSCLLHVLERLHVDYDPEGAADYCHLWNVVGWLLGIAPDLLPLERSEMDELETLIRKRNERPSVAGAQMSVALLDLVRSFIPIAPLKGMAVSTTRLFIGDPTADLLEVPKADWTGRLVGGMRGVSERSSWLVVHDAVVRRLVSRLSRRTLAGFVDHERHGGRPSFTIPTTCPRPSRPARQQRRGRRSPDAHDRAVVSLRHHRRHPGRPRPHRGRLPGA